MKAIAVVMMYKTEATTLHFYRVLWHQGQRYFSRLHFALAHKVAGLGSSAQIVRRRRAGLVVPLLARRQHGRYAQQTIRGSRSEGSNYMGFRAARRAGSCRRRRGQRSRATRTVTPSVTAKWGNGPVLGAVPADTVSSHQTSPHGRQQPSAASRLTWTGQ